MAHGHHIASTRMLTTVFGGLIFLTIITVVTSRIDLGIFNVPLALLIATTKGALVVGFFMAPMHWIERVLAAVAGLVAIAPTWQSDLLALAIVAPVVVTQVVAKRRRAAAASGAARQEA